MFVYLFVGLLVALIFEFNLDNNKKLRFAFIIITVFLSIRYMWGNDYPSYLQWYIDFNKSDFSLFDVENSRSLSKSSEFGWVIINRLAGALGLGFFGLVILLTIFENWSLHRMIAKYVTPKYYWVAVLIWFFSAESFCVNASMMRQYLCMCMYLWVIDLMIEKRKRGYLFWSIGIILICTTIHRSSIILLISLPLFYVNIKNTKISSYLMIILGVLYIIWNIIGPRLLEPYVMLFLEDSDDYAQYLKYIGEEKSSAISTGFGALFRYVMFATWLLFLPKLDKKHQPIMALLIMSYFFSVVASIAPIAGRLGLFFSFLSMICWALLYEKAKENTFLYILFVMQVVIIIRTIPGFFINSIFSERFLQFHTIFEAPSWM